MLFFRFLLDIALLLHSLDRYSPSSHAQLRPNSVYDLVCHTKFRHGDISQTASSGNCRRAGQKKRKEKERSACPRGVISGSPPLIPLPRALSWRFMPKSRIQVEYVHLVLWRRGKTGKAAGGAISLATAEQKLGKHSTESRRRSVYSKDGG